MVLGAVVYIVVDAYLLHVYGQADVDQSVANALPGVIIFPILGWNLLLVVVTILVMIDSIRKVRAGRTRELAAGVFVVKLAAIPFFVINFAQMVLIAFIGMVVFVFGGAALVAVAVISIGLTYLAMLSTSVYGWATIAQLRHEGRIDKRRTVLYSILLAVFVADIVAGILLFVHTRRREKAVLPAT